MYSNYGITSASKTKLKNINKLLVKAFEKEQEDGLWEMWKLQFPNMTKENYVSFGDYKAKLSSPKHTEKTAEGIINEMLPVINAHKKSNGTK